MHVRMMTAAALVESDFVAGNIKGTISQAFFHVDENVGQFSVVHDNGLRLIVALAGGVLTHVDPGGFGSSATVGDSAAYFGHCALINGSGGLRWFRIGGRRSALLFIS